MKNKKLVIGSYAFALFLLVGASSVFAYQGDFTNKGNGNLSEKHQAIQQALEDNDYQTWQELVGDHGRMSEVVTQENFDQFVNAHNLMLTGNYEEARALMEEIGLTGKPMMPGRGHGFGNPEDRQAIMGAIEAGDYEAWSALVEDKPIAEIITEENFDRFVTAHQLMKDGQKYEARELMEELGLEGRAFCKGARGHFNGNK